MNKHYSVAGLLRFTLPVMGAILVTATYTMVDGFFVARWVGSEALAAVNFTFPIPMIISSIGFMLGTGGSAIIARTLGAGHPEQAIKQFSLIVYAGLATGVISGLLALALLRPLLALLGADSNLLQLCLDYGLIMAAGLPAMMVQMMFQELAVTAGKPGFSFAVTVIAGIANIILDALFIIGLGLGIKGAALGTISAALISALVCIGYFARPNSSYLQLGRTNLDWKVLREACINGSSEMVSNIAMSVVAIAYNTQLLLYLGHAGVAAYGVIMYAGMAVGAILVGYVFGSAPLMSYQYGARNREEMQSIFRKSLIIIAVLGISSFLLAQIFVRPFVQIFVGHDAPLVELTVYAARIYAIALLLMGFSMYASGLFTALGNGPVSALISFLRTLVFEVGAVFLLPRIMGADGIWWSIVVAELAAIALAGALVIKLAPRYGYLRQKPRPARA